MLSYYRLGFKPQMDQRLAGPADDCTTALHGSCCHDWLNIYCLAQLADLCVECQRLEGMMGNPQAACHTGSCKVGNSRPESSVTGSSTAAESLSIDISGKIKVFAKRMYTSHYAVVSGNSPNLG